MRRNVRANSAAGSPESHPCGRGHRVSGPANEHKRQGAAGDEGSEGGAGRRVMHLKKMPEDHLGGQIPDPCSRITPVPDRRDRQPRDAARQLGAAFLEAG